jgi:hypothetical protein
MNCNRNCSLCPNVVISTSVTATADNLVIDIPAASYANCRRVCLVVAQTIPDTATINMPVVISIGGETTTLYPVLNCDCTPVTACAIYTRTRYPLVVATTATGANFKSLRKLACRNNNLASIPVTTTTP